MRYVNRRGAVVAAAMAMVGTVAVPTAVEAHGRWRKTVTVHEGESIQAAIDDARRGTRIIVRGHHDENVWIDKDGIQLIGRGGASIALPDDPTPNPCQGQNPETGETFDTVICVFPEPGEFPAADEDRLRNVTIKNLAVSGSTADGISALFVDGLQIRGNTVTDPGCDAIFALRCQRLRPVEQRGEWQPELRWHPRRRLGRRSHPRQRLDRPRLCRLRGGRLHQRRGQAEHGERQLRRHRDPGLPGPVRSPEQRHHRHR